MTAYAFTGHRPKDLGTLNFQSFCRIMDANFEAIERRYQDGSREDPIFITGGALGIDTWAAEYAIDHHIDLWLKLPFTLDVMGKFWTPTQRETFRTIEQHADYVDYEQNPDSFHWDNYQKRNETMVNSADVVIAFYSGKKGGGTYNCVEYAVDRKPVVNLWTGTPRLVARKAKAQIDMGL